MHHLVRRHLVRHLAIFGSIGLLVLALPPTDAEAQARTVQPGAPGTASTVLTPEQLVVPERLRHTEADVRFMQDMMHHHQQAVEMSRMAHGRTENPTILQLAERIERTQADEIALMTRWLTLRGEEVPELHGDHDHQMMDHHGHQAGDDHGAHCPCHGDGHGHDHDHGDHGDHHCDHHDGDHADDCDCDCAHHDRDHDGDHHRDHDRDHHGDHDRDHHGDHLDHRQDRDGERHRGHHGDEADHADHGGHGQMDDPHHGMPGMLSPEQLQELAAARDQEFDRLLLEFMIYHHEGAIQMVSELFASPGAVQDSDIFQFAAHVEADQEIEIIRMEEILRRGR
jgi:uncharacterized protein (DUF305 family)